METARRGTKKREDDARLETEEAVRGASPLGVVVNKKGPYNQACKFGGSLLFLAVSGARVGGLERRHTDGVLAPKKCQHNLPDVPLDVEGMNKRVKKRREPEHMHRGRTKDILTPT